MSALFQQQQQPQQQQLPQQQQQQQQSAYDAYRSYQPSDQYDKYMRWALKYNYAAFDEMRVKNPVAYSEWYQRNYVGQRYAATVATATTAGSLAASEADRASVHSGRSSVNDDHASMIMSSKIRGSTTGLDQSHSYDYNGFQVNNKN